MADCDEMDVRPRSEIPLGEETVFKHDDDILHDCVSGQAALVDRDNVQEFVKDGDSLSSWDFGDYICLGTHKPDNVPSVPCVPNCSVMLKEEEADDGSDCSQGMEVVASIGDQLGSDQLQVAKHLEDTKRDVTDVFSQKKDIREAVEAAEGDIREVFSQKEEDDRDAVDTVGSVTEVFSQKEEDVRDTVGSVTEVFSQKEEDVRDAVDTVGCMTEVFRQEEDVRDAVEDMEGDGTYVLSQKEDIREAVDTEADIEDILSQKNQFSDILDIDYTEHVKSDNVTVRENDELFGANHIHVTEVSSKVFSQNKNDDTVPGPCVLKEDVVTMANEDITHFYEPTGENNVTEAAFVSPVGGFGNFGNHGNTECSEEASLLNEDVEYCKDAHQCLIPQQAGGGCPTDTGAEGAPGVSGVVGVRSDQQGQDKNTVCEEKTDVLDESIEHSFTTVKQILTVSTLDSDCVLQTDDQPVADQNDENSECRVKRVACDAEDDVCAADGEEATWTESAGNGADCIWIPVGAATEAPPRDLGDVAVVRGDCQPHFDLSDTFNMFAEEDHLDQFVTENNDQRVSSQDVPPVVNVRQNAVSARAKKRKKEKAKLEKLLARNTTSRAARARRYAASFQELLANKEDTFHPDFTCPVCLDLYHKPHVVHPCQHMFCEPCLRKLPSSALADNAVCPLCRQDIRACIMDVDLHIQLSDYYSDIYIKRARQEKKLKTNQKPLPRIQSQPLSQQLIRHILSNQSNRRSDGNGLHMVLSMCLSAVLSVLYVWMNIPIEITGGRLRNAAVSNVWVQAICLFCAFMWLFVKVLGKLATRERR